LVGFLILVSLFSFTKANAMLFSSNSILNINTGTETGLYVKELANTLAENSISGLQKGGSFGLDYTSADFFITHSHTKLIYRFKDNFFMNKYTNKGELI